MATAILYLLLQLDPTKTGGERSSVKRQSFRPNWPDLAGHPLAAYTIPGCRIQYNYQPNSQIKFIEGVKRRSWYRRRSKAYRKMLQISLNSIT